jgi:hypothetical protein
MSRRKSLSGKLFSAARVTDDLEAFGSGEPSKMARRTKNVAVGRSAARGGVWRRLFGGGRRKGA